MSNINDVSEIGSRLGRGGPPLDDLARYLMAGVDPTGLFDDVFGNYLEFMAFMSPTEEWYLDWGPFQSDFLEWPTTLAMLQAETRDLYRRQLLVCARGDGADPGERPRKRRVVETMGDLLDAAGCATDRDFQQHLWEVTAGPLAPESVAVFEDADYMMGIVHPGPGGSEGMVISQAIEFPTTLEDTESEYRDLLHTVTHVWIQEEDN